MVGPQRLGVEAALTGDARLLKQAMMMDPLTAAVCTTPEIWRMTDELLVAQADVLPQYADAIREAKENLASSEPGSEGEHDLWPPTRQRPRGFDELTADEQTHAVFMRVFTGQHVRAQ